MAGISIFLDRLQAGLERRLAFVGRTEGASPNGGPPSVFRTFLARQSDNPGAAPHVDRRWFPVFAASRWPTLDEQYRALQSLAEPKDIGFSALYTVGSILGQTKLTDQILADLTDEDYSILVESHVRSSTGDEHCSEARDYCDAFVACVRSEGDLPDLSPFSRVVRRFRHLLPYGDIDDFAGFRLYLAELKRCAVHLIGPDAISVFQALADPSFRVTAEQMTSIVSVLKAWDLETSGHALLYARLTGPYSAEQASIKASLADGQMQLSDQARSDLTRLVEESHTIRRSPKRPETYEERILYELAYLSEALVQRSPIDTSEAVARIYSVDRALIDFLPWDRIVPVVQRARMSTPAAAFTAMLTSSKSFKKAFPGAWLRMGNGAFIAALTSLLPPEGNLDLAASLFSRIKDLPLPAASEITKGILKPEIFDRLIAASLAPRVLEEFLGQQSSFSLLRIEALGIAETRGLIGKDYAEEQISHESDQARLQSLETMMRSGRVRVPLQMVEESARWHLEAMPLDLMRTDGMSTLDAPAIDRAVHYFAERFAKYVLLESPSSINQALSNNLRHGFIIPRFLRAFDDALQVTLGSARRELPQWGLSSLADRFQSQTGALIELRKWFDERLRTFQDEWLSIAPNGELHQELRDAFIELLKSKLQVAPNGIDTFCQAASAKTEEAIGRALKRAAAYLENDIKRDVLEQLREVHRQSKSRNNDAALGYLDTLETLLHDAFEEVSEWLGIAEEASESGPFTLQEMVKLELASTHSANWRRLKVDVTSIDPTLPEGGVPLIGGRYFDLFQDVVHNLLSNAFTHSGLRLRTEVTLQLRADRNVLSLKCESNIAPDQLPAVYKNRRDIQRRARRRLDGRAAEDKLSGFSKIRLAYLRSFGAEPALSIEIVRHRGRGAFFSVDLVADNAPRIWDA